ncbi:MAG TPA: TVP38/TMEM64 family protein [Herpetosiphonaceae bacterium]|nr:TVP38/TMEM64 family protein [Herpetosiphonaceae bacterium]
MTRPSQSNAADHTLPQRATIDTRYVVWLRLALTLMLVVVLALAYLLSATFRSEVNRAAEILGRGDVAGLRDYILSFGVWAPVVSALLMILQALAAPLPGFLLAFANGLAFGAFWGGMLSFVSAALAATISFWLARALGRPPVEALVGKAGLEQADRWFARWGTYTVLIARLVPIVSFDIISYAAGLTPMRFRNFLGATLLGMAPATFLYAYLGEQAPQYVQVLLVAFGAVIVGAAILAVVRRWNRSRAVS